MRRARPSQPDLFKTLPAYQLPSSQRTIAVELLKVLLAEVMISVAQVGRVGNDGMDDRELGNEQDHR
jgi:hypothetical protein